MIAAILAVPDYKDFYNGVSCGEARAKLLVKIVALPQVFPPESTCAAYPFRVFHGERDVKGAILQLGINRDASDYSYSAKYVQPNLTELPDGTFESVDYYCFIAGRLERRNGRWMAHAYDDKR